MMNQDQRRCAAELLWSAWNDERRIDAIPDPFRPTSRADGYQVHQSLAEISGQATVGWKIAATAIIDKPKPADVPSKLHFFTGAARNCSAKKIGGKL